MIERAVVLCASDHIQATDLLSKGSVTPVSTEPEIHDDRSGDFHARVKAYKEAILRAALRDSGGNQTKAAELLCLQRTYLVKMLRALNIRQSGEDKG